MARRTYSMSLIINQRDIHSVIIDDHYEKKHSDTINDELVLNLVSQLDQKYFEPVDIKEPYSFFVLDQLEYQSKYYKLIWLLEKDEMYIGVINAYRRPQKGG